eukprot:comp18721_c0_seq1/m.20476 comp18721_c0_seq1/g.20476  ORF comp18721_c0_seq1/g.20476 comp18721_c0_seq1/m.20476 type:complete len:320 (-) comp18721_c0_seq1:405-1364(-)
MATETDGLSGLVKAFLSNLKNDPDVPTAVAAVQALIQFIETSEAKTIMEIRQDMTRMVKELTTHAPEHIVSLASGCELFMRFVTRTGFLNVQDIAECKRVIIECGRQFVKNANHSRDVIASVGDPFIRDGATILTHARSRVVAQLLLKCAEKKQFQVYVTESRPDCSGYYIAEQLRAGGIPVTMVLDAAVGSVMEKVDLVVVGAEGIVENGGIINKIGTYNLALAAHAANKPFYAVAESFKFARLFPLKQGDIPRSRDLGLSFKRLPGSTAEASTSGDTLQYFNPWADYTPPQYITLLFTDLGVLTPSAVSDELIQLYQ